MPVRTMSAAQEDTLAPWVQRVVTATSRRAANRTRGRPDGQPETSRRVRDGLGTPTQPIPALTSSLPTTRTLQKVPARRCAGAPPWPGPPPLPVGQAHRLPGPRRAASACREICPPGAGPRPPAPDRRRCPSAAASLRRGPPGRPGHCHPEAGHRAAGPGHPRQRLPATGRSMAARHMAAGHRRTARGRPPHCRPAAGQHMAAGHRAAGPGHPRHRHPVAAHPEAGHRGTAPGRPPHCRPAAGQHMAAGHRGTAPPCPGRRLRRGRVPRPASSPPGIRRRAPPGIRRRAALPTPAAMTPPREPPRLALPPPAGRPRAGGHRGGEARSGATRPCRANRARFTRPASSLPGTGRLCAPHGWA
jgi:hypothetical protein